MHRQAWAILLLVLTLALAACGDEPEPAPPTQDNAPAQATPAAPVDLPPEELAPVDDLAATEEPAPNTDEPDDNVVPPGLHARAGLTVVRSTEYAEGGTGAFFAEVRNDTGETLRAVDGSIDLLDAENTRLRAVALATLLNDIPPGESIFLGSTFPLPQGYADAAVWLDYTPVETPSLDAFFALPVTFESHGPGESALYAARGTVENNTGRDLVFWAVTVAALDADNQIIGLAHAIVTPESADGSWPAGASAPFVAMFGSLAGDASTVTTVAASAVGYALIAQ